MAVFEVDRYRNIALVGHGGSGTDIGRDAAVDGSNNLYVVGLFDKSVDFGSGAVSTKGSIDVFLLKLTP